MKTTDKALIEKLKELILEKDKIIKEYQDYVYNQTPFNPEAIEFCEDNVKELESEIASLEAQDKEPSDKKEYHACPHPEIYRFVDKEGYERCASCHGYIDFSNRR